VTLDELRFTKNDGYDGWRLSQPLRHRETGEYWMASYKEDRPDKLELERIENPTGGLPGDHFGFTGNEVTGTFEVACLLAEMEVYRE
jgi:hypothetical protein